MTAAALASGRVLAPGAPVGSATGLPQRVSQQVQEAATTVVTGGDRYDQGRFLGTEYRKRSAQGQPVIIDGVQWAVGQRSNDQQSWASARAAGLAATTGVTIGIGRTLPAAIELLKRPDTRIVETADSQIQLYDGGQLVAVYDPQQGIAGDTHGTPNASSEQMAAIIAYHALRPQNPYDRGLAQDLAAALDGTGRSLAAIDAAYLAITNGPLAGGGTLTLGAQVGTRRCPDCGQFMGDAHLCRSAGQQSCTGRAAWRGRRRAPTSELPSAGSVPEGALAPPAAPAEPPAQVAVQLDAQALAAALASALPSQPPLDAQQLAAALAAALPPQQTLDPQAFAAALASALAAQPAPQVSVQLDPSALAEAVRAGAAQALAGAFPQPIDPQALADALRAGMAAAPAPQVTVQAPPPTAQVQLQVDSGQLADALRASLGTALNTVASARGDEPVPTRPIRPLPHRQRGSRARVGRGRPGSLPPARSIC